MIPQRIVGYWFGEADPCWLRMETMRIATRLHPGWPVWLVREYPSGGESDWERVDEGPEGDDEVEDVPVYRVPDDVPPDVRADVFRWHYLAAVGGWFLDLDVLLTGPLPEHDADLVVTLDGGTPAPCGRAYAIGAVAGRPSRLTQELASVARRRLAMWRPGDPHQACGSEMLRDHLRQLEGYLEARVVGLPAASLYPQGFLRRESVRVWDEPEEAPRELGALELGELGLHWGGGHERSRERAPSVDEAWARASQSAVARAWRAGMMGAK